MSEEEWRAVVGYEGAYEVSSIGRVRSLVRTVHLIDGRVRVFPGVMLRLRLDRKGYPIFMLKAHNVGRNFFLHRLIAEAFIPNPHGYPEVRHLDDIKTNYGIENLAWGTHSDNMQDAVRNGVQPEARKTHCPQGHEYSEDNTYQFGNNRQCRACRAEKTRNRRAKVPPLSPDDPRHGTLNGYNGCFCRCSACRAASATYARENRAAKREMDVAA